jgi:hypothetical protein
MRKVRLDQVTLDLSITGLGSQLDRRFTFQTHGFDARDGVSPKRDYQRLTCEVDPL